ncbi:MAG: hypothetical protein H8E21_11560 [Gammaproteobacteria bacterium]|nr:hypothetical protein [Gammaproteobacteria bacterium]MBL6998235.1 hypothetical protein [Gammaproteobacteria bacterium]
MFLQASSLILLALGIFVFVYVGHVMARKKGLNPRFWGVMGGLLGPLVIPLILFSKPHKKNSE